MIRSGNESLPYGIHWFRRDLRVVGNPALEWNREQNQGRVVGIFVIDPQILSRADTGINRLAFFMETLNQLRHELRTLGGDLLVLDQGPERAFCELFSTLEDTGCSLPASFSFNRDYEPFARARDTRIETLLRERFRIRTTTHPDHLLIEPEELFKDRPGSFYQVYTPFQKKWTSLLRGSRFQERVRAQRASLRYLDELSRGEHPKSHFCLSWKELLSGHNSGAAHRRKAETRARLSDRLEDLGNRLKKEIDIPLPEAGSLAAFRALKFFQKEALDDYFSQRDFPAISGTSRLSIYLKTGSITVAGIISALGLPGSAKSQLSGSRPDRESKTKFLSELIWREFYYHILYHCPRVENEAFLSRYQSIAWENDDRKYEAWCQGRTGYPIVDAAMRQLNTTGWMHNRMRMVVASFLTKDLLISWQWGERYFMQKLLDGDLALNNGGWQWAASTGCDPQPYFRIFNPVLQSRRFDPEGAYIRRYVPELNHLNSRLIHEPWRSPEKTPNYPAPIVNHAIQSRKAIALFKKG